MSYAIVDNKTFLPLFTVNVTTGDYYRDGKQIAEGQICYSFDEQKISSDELLLNYYWKNGEWAKKTPRPSEFHRWVAESEEWIFDVSTLVSRKKEEINKERVARAASSITFEGRVLDADFVAQQNINGKISEIEIKQRLGIEIPETSLIWRDADNQNLVFDSVSDYLNWLTGLKIAIIDRGTALYVKAWAHKAQIETYESEGKGAEIFQYDVKSDWI